MPMFPCFTQQENILQSYTQLKNKGSCSSHCINVCMQWNFSCTVPRYMNELLFTQNRQQQQKKKITFCDIFRHDELE